MSDKINQLKKDIERLKKSIDWHEKQLDDIDNGCGTAVQSDAPALIKAKTEAEKLRDEKEKELLMAEYTAGNAVSAADALSQKRIFDSKDQMYGTVRNSYMKSLDF